jgi:isoleucyl-tRNA synthetase
VPGSFQPLAEKPDHPALEHEVLDLWEREQTFAKLREQNRGGPRWSFIDGPITANNPMGVHHAWGRALKDVFQRYKALRGFDERYQNGFDCQGLWVEVEVEKSLGLNSKREIEEYGLAEFAERCKERVAHFVGVMTGQSKRLGQWMDWGNDYLTFSDTNIEYIWRFLKEVHSRGWLYQGHRSTQWCPRCGTSLSQHEQAGEDKYRELSHPSLYVRFPLEERQGESLLIWTTTPWTLPANVAAAVKPDAEYVRLESGDWVARARYPDEPTTASAGGEELVGLHYRGPFDDLDAQQGVVHRVIPWDEVSLEEGTGIVHIAPGAGTDDFELSGVHDLPVLVPVNEAGRFYAGYGGLQGLSTDEAEAPIVERLRAEGLLVSAGRIEHRYPICWRCATPLIFRVVDDWFISVDEIRTPLLEANQKVAWTPEFYSRRMDDWLRNMDDWNISRKRYFGLPLPFYPCECGLLNVLGSRAELEERAVRGLDQLQELHRPWIDAVPIACERCGAELQRIPEVGDAWLDAGIVPLSTLGWQNEHRVPGGYGTGAARGLTGADLPDHAYWEQWFPADCISESREQIRLWFYSISVMSMTLTGRLPYRAVLTYERVRDETGREMHKSWGNAIEANEAFEQMGADIVRFLFSAQVPSQNVNFGYGPANEVKRRLLTFWNSTAFFVTYAGIEGFKPAYAELAGGPQTGTALDEWLVARVEQLVSEATEQYERFWTPGVTRAFESFVEDLSNWYIRRSRPRFWDGDDAALGTLWYAVVQALRVIAPVMPFLAESLWQNLVRGACEGAPDSVFLAGWPQPGPPDEALLAAVREVRRIVELGHQARGEVEGLTLRQPLRRMFVRGSSLAGAHADEIADELNVKEVRFDEGPVARVQLKPNLPVLGPRLGAKLPGVKAALDAGDYEELGDGRVRAAGEELGADDVIRGERLSVDGFAMADDDVVSVALSTELDDELRLEKRARDLIRRLNQMRKDAGLEITDRIVLTVPVSDADLVSAHGEWIKQETLAVELRVDGTELQIEKA